VRKGENPAVRLATPKLDTAYGAAEIVSDPAKSMKPIGRGGGGVAGTLDTLLPAKEPSARSMVGSRPPKSSERKEGDPMGRQNNSSKRVNRKDSMNQ